MIHASTTPFVGTAKAARPLHRVQVAPLSFWTLFVIQAMLVLMLGFAVARVLPTMQPLAATPDYGVVREAVFQRVNGTIVDPLIELQSGVTAPASSVRGFALNGATYYYQIAGQPNFDPLSRHLVGFDQVYVVLRDTNGPHALTIYTLAN